MRTTSGSPAFKSEPEAQPDAEYAAFEREFEALSGISLNLYKEKQMKRRINTLIARKGFENYDGLLSALKSDPAEYSAFLDYTTINVTEFFRTPEHWDCFEKEAIGDLAGREEGQLKIWSCACSTGEEPYSAAISFSRRMPLSRFRILATDIDEKVIAQAREGVYSEQSLEKLPDAIRERYFIRSNAGRRIIDELRERVHFSRLDLLRDEYPQQCDLIICRNVLIYFTEEAKDGIYERISGSLKPGGYLFTGNVEQIIYYKRYGLEKMTGYLYRKIRIHDGNAVSGH